MTKKFLVIFKFSSKFNIKLKKNFLYFFDFSIDKQKIKLYNIYIKKNKKESW